MSDRHGSERGRDQDVIRSRSSSTARVGGSIQATNKTNKKKGRRKRRKRKLPQQDKRNEMASSAIMVRHASHHRQRDETRFLENSKGDNEQKPPSSSTTSRNHHNQRRGTNRDCEHYRRSKMHRPRSPSQSPYRRYHHHLDEYCSDDRQRRRHSRGNGYQRCSGGFPHHHDPDTHPRRRRSPSPRPHFHSRYYSDDDSYNSGYPPNKRQRQRQHMYEDRSRQPEDKKSQHYRHQRHWHRDDAVRSGYHQDEDRKLSYQSHDGRDTEEKQGRSVRSKNESLHALSYNDERNVGRVDRRQSRRNIDGESHVYGGILRGQRHRDQRDGYRRGDDHDDDDDSDLSSSPSVSLSPSPPSSLRNNRWQEEYHRRRRYRHWHGQPQIENNFHNGGRSRRRHHHHQAVISDDDEQDDQVASSAPSISQVPPQQQQQSMPADKKEYTKKSRHGKSKKYQGRQHHHQSCRDKSAGSAFHDDTSEKSHHDDTVGHFQGGPGTIIDNRYQVVSDVGLGTFGRVVECVDLEKSHRNCQRSQGLQSDHVAIKIVRNIKRYYDSAKIEADILKDVNRRGGRGVSHCVELIDTFTSCWSSPSSPGHFCLVFESLGPSLYDFLKRHNYQPFPMVCIRDFARQLLEAVDFLHSFGLVHTDLKPENILLTNYNEKRLYGSGYQQHGATRNFVIPESTHIKIIDFGGATYDDEKKSSVVNTRQYRAPEVILGVGWSTPSDLWSAGCILAELYLGELLFATHENYEHLALIERCIGYFPIRMLRKAALQAHPHGQPSHQDDYVNAPLISNNAIDAFDRITGRHHLSQVLSQDSYSYVQRMLPLESLIVNEPGFLDLLRRLLVIDPDRRETARELVDRAYHL